MTTPIPERLRRLREQMKKRGIAVYLINGTDPHMSEYVPERWRTRAWISGFTGSAGTVIVTLNEAYLWADFRYYIQAPKELEGSGILLHKLGAPDVKTPSEWLHDSLSADDVVGVNGSTFPAAAFKTLETGLKAKGIQLRAQPDLLDFIWDDRPPIPTDIIRDFSEAFAGKSRVDKLQDLRTCMREKGADYLIVSALDEIAWTLNVRGSDVAFTPVAVAHLLIGLDGATLFIDPDKVPAEVETDLIAAGVNTAPYDDLNTVLGRLPTGCGILVDPDKMAIDAKRSIPEHCRHMEEQSPIAIRKCRKNAVELEGIRAANHRDGVALVKFLSWLDREVPKGGVTELTVADKLVELRRQNDHFLEPSFGTIAGYAEHGALCHYSATPESAHELKPEGFCLVDSGAQYLDGTTDVTRTVALGPLTDKQKRDFTLVLKCHVQVANAKFPVGTSGGQLELLGKYPLWRERATYNHGLGHGIGHCLGVHEGPAGFSKGNAITLEPGMVLTNEPGLYREGEYGIRTENVVVVREDEESEFGKFLRFETIHFCPIDRRAIDAALLDDFEREWINTYHAHTLKALGPFLDERDAAWLKEACRPI